MCFCGRLALAIIAFAAMASDYCLAEIMDSWIAAAKNHRTRRTCLLLGCCDFVGVVAAVGAYEEAAVVRQTQN